MSHAQCTNPLCNILQLLCQHSACSWTLGGSGGAASCIGMLMKSCVWPHPTWTHSRAVLCSESLHNLIYSIKYNNNNKNSTVLDHIQGQYCIHAGEDQMQQLVQQVVAFLLQGVPTSTSFATATHNMAAGSAFGLLTDCLQQGLPIGKAVALWGPSVCRYVCLLLCLCTGLLVFCCPAV